VVDLDGAAFNFDGSPLAVADRVRTGAAEAVVAAAR
jgi:hypothetical protein